MEYGRNWRTLIYHQGETIHSLTVPSAAELQKGQREEVFGVAKGYFRLDILAREGLKAVSQVGGLGDSRRKRKAYAHHGWSREN